MMSRGHATIPLVRPPVGSRRTALSRRTPRPRVVRTLITARDQNGRSSAQLGPALCRVRRDVRALPEPGGSAGIGQVAMGARGSRQSAVSSSSMGHRSEHAPGPACAGQRSAHPHEGLDGSTDVQLAGSEKRSVMLGPPPTSAETAERRTDAPTVLDAEDAAATVLDRVLHARLHPSRAVDQQQQLEGLPPGVGARNHGHGPRRDLLRQAGRVLLIHRHAVLLGLEPPDVGNQALHPLPA